MNGLPWTNHAARVGGHDEGGMEHLETDVMRFMAILAFCLVAIFALVQSIPIPPATPAPPESPPAVAPSAPVETAVVELEAPEPVTPAPVEVVEEEPPLPGASAQVKGKVTQPPSPERLLVPARVAPPRRAEPQTVELVMPKPRMHTPPTKEAAVPVAEPVREPAPVPQPEPVAAAPTAAPEQPPAPAPTSDREQKGFSLRFDSDAALRQLVARDEVALYAIAGKKAWRVMMVSERLSFRPAQTPARFHEMAAATVPQDVVKTLRRLVTVSPDRLTWGVTLPASTSRQLSEFLSAYDSGGLVIDASGGLRLEQG